MAYRSQKQAYAHQAVQNRERDTYRRSINWPTVFAAKYRGNCKCGVDHPTMITPGDEVCYYQNRLMWLGCAERIATEAIKCVQCGGVGYALDWYDRETKTYHDSEECELAHQPFTF